MRALLLKIKLVEKMTSSGRQTSARMKMMFGFRGSAAVTEYADSNMAHKPMKRMTMENVSR